MISCVWGKSYDGSVMKFIYFTYIFLIHIMNLIHKFHIFNLPNHSSFRKTICLNLFNYDIHFQHSFSVCYVSIN